MVLTGVEQSLLSNREALAIAAQAKVLFGSKLEQMVARLQRYSGKSKGVCWQFLIQYGLKSRLDHRRWTEAEIEMLREGRTRS